MTTARTRLVASLLLAFALAGCGALIPAHYRITAARKDLKRGDWRGASVELRTVVQVHPENAEAWLLLTRLSLDANDPVDAPANLRHALAAGAKGPEVDELRVRTWLETGQPKAALDALAHHTVSLQEPGRSLARARAHLALGQTDEALSSLKSLLASHTDLPQADLTKARVLMAEALARSGQLDKALGQLHALMQQDPKSPEPPLLEGRLLASRGHFSEAEAALTQALGRMPPAEPIAYRVSALVTLTEARLAQGEIDAAGKSEALLSQLVPGAPVTHVLDARLKLAHGALRDGIDELERVVADVPNYTEARMLLGGALVGGGDLEQAQEQLEQVVQQAPDDLEARKLLATVRLKLNDPQAALSVLTPILSSQAADPQTLALLGATAVRMGDSSSALATLANDAQAHPDNLNLQLNLAQAYLVGGHADQALALLEKTTDDKDFRRDTLFIAALNSARGPHAASQQVERLLAKRPHDAGALSLGGTYFASEGDLDRARTLLSQAMALDPRDQAAAIELARIQTAAGDASAAKQTLQSVLAADPKALPVRLALADVLVDTKAFDQAAALLQEVDASQSGPGVQFALARVHLAQGDLKQAEAALDRAIAMRPGQAATIEDAGAVLLAARQYDAALARFAQATTLAPDNPLYWFNAARAQLASNQPAAARSSLQKASGLRPNSLPIVGTLALMDVREHNDKAAFDRVNALLGSEPRDPAALTLKGDVEAAAGNTADALAAYAAAQRQQPSATVAVKEFQVALAAHEGHPEKPLLDWLAKQPNDARVRDVLGNYYLGQHDFRGAAQAFEAVVRLAPGNVVALNNLAWVDDRLGDAKAEALAQRAYALAPQSANVDDTLGWILARKGGEAARAVPLLAQAVKLAPGDPEIRYHYAYALVQDGRRAEARDILSKLLAEHASFDSHSDAERLLAATRT